MAHTVQGVRRHRPHSPVDGEVLHAVVRPCRDHGAGRDGHDSGAAGATPGAGDVQSDLVLPSSSFDVFLFLSSPS